MQQINSWAGGWILEKIVKSLLLFIEMKPWRGRRRTHAKHIDLYEGDAFGRI